MSKRNEVFERLLSDWYGPELAPAEIAARHNGLRPVGNLLDKALKNVVPATTLALSKLRAEWPGVVGKDTAHHSNPLFVKEGILHIEYANPVFRMALDTPSMREGLLLKVHEICGPRFCTGIRFIPCGRTSFFRRTPRKAEKK